MHEADQPRKGSSSRTRRTSAEQDFASREGELRNSRDRGLRDWDLRDWELGDSRKQPSSQGRGRAVSDEAAPEEEPQRKATFAQRMQERRRTMDKERAKRKYQREFRGSDRGSSSGDDSAGPRAAVYRGEMGSNQRRANRMQGSDVAPTAGRAAKSRKSSRHPFAAVTAVVALSLVLACVFMYPTAQQYYLALREHDKLQAEYEAVLNRNAALQDQVNTLSTDEGVKAYVHDRYGWVSEGENAVVVQGLNDGSENGLSDVTANVIPGSVKAPDTWYSSTLDSFFGYE